MPFDTSVLTSILSGTYLHTYVLMYFGVLVVQQVPSWHPIAAGTFDTAGRLLANIPCEQLDLAPATTSTANHDLGNIAPELVQHWGGSVRPLQAWCALLRDQDSFNHGVSTAPATLQKRRQANANAHPNANANANANAQVPLAYGAAAQRSSNRNRNNNNNNNNRRRQRPQLMVCEAIDGQSLTQQFGFRAKAWMSPQRQTCDDFCASKQGLVFVWLWFWLVVCLAGWKLK